MARYLAQGRTFMAAKIFAQACLEFSEAVKIVPDDAAACQGWCSVDRTCGFSSFRNPVGGRQLTASSLRSRASAASSSTSFAFGETLRLRLLIQLRFMPFPPLRIPDILDRQALFRSSGAILPSDILILCGAWQPPFQGLRRAICCDSATNSPCGACHSSPARLGRS